MWCGEARNESQKGYVNQLKMIIPEVFAPKDAMPLVQCMNSYETVYTEHEAEAKEMVGTLWQKYWTRCVKKQNIWVWKTYV